MSQQLDTFEQKLISRHRDNLISEEFQYLHLLEDIMEQGTDKGDRTGVGTRSIFGTQLKFDLEKSFPILTTKRVFWKGVVEELLWFIRGDTNSKHLEDKGVNIWKGNTSREFLDNMGLTYPEGFIGPGYGFQWRQWNGEYTIDGLGHVVNNAFTDKGVDQLSDALDKIKNKPNDRRIIVSAWNPTQIDKMALPPCHMMFQFYVADGKLHCQWYQRSVDCFLGLPFNISSYALLTCLFAKAANLTPGTLTFCGGDTHVYQNHFDQCKLQMSRKPFKFPTLSMPDITSLEDIEQLSLSDFAFDSYDCHPPIKAPMAV